LLALLLHLLGHGLSAFSQGFQGAPLRIDRPVIARGIAFGQTLLGVAHGSLGLFEALFAFHAELFHPALEILKPLAERFLTTLEVLLALLLPFSRLAFLVGLFPIRPASVLALTVLKSFVTQLLLLARQAIKFAQRPVHFARHLVLLIAALGILQIFHQAL
jgi:hypothetical protein